MTSFPRGTSRTFPPFGMTSWVCHRVRRSMRRPAARSRSSHFSPSSSPTRSPVLSATNAKVFHSVGTAAKNLSLFERQELEVCRL